MTLSKLLSPILQAGVFVLGALVALLTIAPQPVCGQASGVAVSAQASTLGPSAGVHIKGTESLRIRLRGSYLPYSYSRQIDDDDITAGATADLKLGGPEARLDWHPFKSSFYLTGGALLNVTEVDASVTPTEPYQYNDEKTFSPEKMGSLEGTVSYSTIAPYAGLGFGDAVSGRWSFLVELGAYYTGSPNVSMKGTGLIKPTEQNETVLEEGFESFVVLPHLAVGLAYQF